MLMKKIAIATAATLALAAASAFAVTAQSGVYVGAVAGYAFASAPSTSNYVAGYSNAGISGVTSATKKNKNYTWGATVGYDYALNQTTLVGAELGYVNLGKTSYTSSIGTEDMKNTGVQLLATGTYLLNNGFNTFAKLGAIDLKTNDQANPTLGGSGSTTKWVPAAAIGAGYEFNQNLNVALQYEHAFGSNWNISSGTLSKPMTQDVVTLGVNYKFAM